MDRCRRLEGLGKIHRNIICQIVYRKDILYRRLSFAPNIAQINVKGYFFKSYAFMSFTACPPIHLELSF